MYFVINDSNNVLKRVDNLLRARTIACKISQDERIYITAKGVKLSAYWKNRPILLTHIAEAIKKDKR